MSGKRTLSSLFDKYNAIGYEKNLLDNATLVGNMQWDSQSRIFEVKAEIPFVVPKDKLYLLEFNMAKAYDVRTIHIMPRYSAELFTEAYFGDIMKEACRRDIISSSFLGRYKAVFSDGNICIHTGFGQGGVRLLVDSNADKKISDIIYDEFGIRYKISIVEDSTVNTGIRINMEERLAEARRSAMQSFSADKPDSTPVMPSIYTDNPPITVDENGIYHIGYMLFDLSSSERIAGQDFDIGTPQRLHDMIGPANDVVLVGVVTDFEVRQRRRGKEPIWFCINDGNAAVSIRFAQAPSENEDYKNIIDGMAIAIHGDLHRDEFDNELVMVPRGVRSVKQVQRADTAPQKRVELHLHTTMSTMDGVIPPAQAVNTALAWGHKAIALTDHGNVQGFMAAAVAAKGKDIKLLYGMEGYFVDDTDKAAFGVADIEYSDEFVVFDIETTGLSAEFCKITEIGAVRVKDGEVLDTFETFVNPQVPIPEQITEITGITDKMVADAPTADVAVADFLKFVGDDVVVAHNATFDTSFIRKVADDNGYKFTNAFLDTLAISRFINPDLKKHKLDILADYFNLGDFGHHRAYNDAEMTAKIMYCMFDKLRKEGVENASSMIHAMQDKSDPLKLKPFHQILIAKNKTGLKNLYKIVSNGYLNCYYRHPRIPKTYLMAHREGLIIGSACEAGELYTAILEGKTEDEIKSIAQFYDYLEIQPLSNNSFMIAKGLVGSEEDLKEINRKIVKLGDELGKPVVATCDAHVLDEHDEIYRSVLLCGMKFADADNSSKLYLRTTDEMLKEFAYLGEEKAYEVVVTNTNLIADMVEPDMLPFPDGTFTPHMDGAEEDLQRICHEHAVNMYGDPIPDIVSTRLDKELTSIIKNGFAVLYMIAQKLVWYSESQGYLVGSRGSVGSSFVATMAGISEVNPLLPHYYCPQCKYSEFITDGSYGSGFDLPDKKCPCCGTPLRGDGNDIPFETFLGFKGDKSPDIDLNFSGEVQGKVHKYTEELFGTENVFRAGTIGEVASKTAFGFVMKYLDEHKQNVSVAEKNRLVSKCVGVKRTTGQHPGGIVVVPKEYEIYDFCPVQHPADDPHSDIITTHFTFEYLHDTLLKLDELGHDIPTKYKYIEKFSNSSVLDVPMNAPDVYELFSSTKPLGVTPEEIYSQIGTLGLPELGTNFVQQVVIDSRPKNFADMMQVSGLTHGTDVWLGNAQDLIKKDICTISEVVGTRDGIMLDLIRYGLDNSLSFKIMEFVRKNKKGKIIPQEMQDAMRAKNVPEWYIDSLQKIKYMFPKAHAAAYVMSAIRLGWYKVNDPVSFYAGFFCAAPVGFDASIVMKGIKAVRKTIEELQEKGRDCSQKESEMLDKLMLANEYMARGYEFLPVDLYKSDARLFIPENGKIRLPFGALPGVGESAALALQNSRPADGQEYFSIEELKERSGVTKAVIETLTDAGVLNGLSETNQLTLF